MPRGEGDIRRPSQADYYRELGLQPIRKSVEEPSEFQRFLRVRRHLYQDLLGIPMVLLADKDVLEIGCSTGESALAWALQRARLTLLEPERGAERRCRELFDRFSVTDRIRRFEPCGFEDFEDEPIFALATAEGFLFTMAERDRLLRKMSHLLIPGGLGVVSFPDRCGSFLEFVKKAAMWRAYQEAGLEDARSDEAFAIASKLLEPAHRLLPNPRQFRTWWLDCMTSPFLTWADCWDYEAVLEVLEEAGCHLYSSIPRVFEPDPLSWYKTVPTKKDRGRAISDSIAIRRFDFLVGHQLGLHGDREGLAAATKMVRDILEQLSRYFDGLEAPPPQIDFEPLRRQLKALGADHPLFADLTEFFRVLAGEGSSLMTEKYPRFAHLGRAWGCSYHYLCFVREHS